MQAEAKGRFGSFPRGGDEKEESEMRSLLSFLLAGSGGDLPEGERIGEKQKRFHDRALSCTAKDPGLDFGSM